MWPGTTTNKAGPAAARRVHRGHRETGQLGPTTFAALNVGTGQVFGECEPTRDGADFLAMLNKAVKRHSDTDIHVVLDNLNHLMGDRSGRAEASEDGDVTGL